MNLLSRPKRMIGDTAKIGQGLVLRMAAIMGLDATLDLANIINTKAAVDHDGFLGNAVHVCWRTDGRD